MKGKDALRLKREILEKQKIDRDMKLASDNLSMISAKKRAKMISNEIRKKIFD